jgi:hypothetical protein
MESFIKILIQYADTFFGSVNVFLACAGDIIGFLAAGDSVGLLLAAHVTNYFDIPEEILAVARKWHGKIEDKFSNIENLVVTIQAHSSWGVPTAVFQQIVSNRAQLAQLIPKCSSSHGSPTDLAHRNELLKSTVELCIGHIRAWSCAQYYNNVMTLADIHSLGFLLYGESGGRRARSKPTDAVPEVKVKIISSDVIRVVIDQSASDNAALAAHGWPPGVRMALIVITSADGLTEVVRRHTSRLHNEIRMPEGSHGKAFIIKASFLKHVDDEPRFGPQPTFSMPLTTADLVSTVDARHKEDRNANIGEIERLRREMEQIKKQLARLKPSD